ncbi:acriflavin resistance protein [Halorhodospira abdelmalekii]|uniref:efflux RND transporter permease subunit n=1 Tax=Halorhodospira abdelmalekii TaxID=421629 RepID=UPI0019052BD3|nr:acriflavin resistance protein [Halorhodospira abdelmalekii]
MKLAAFCARRPVFTVMVTLIAVVLGLNSLDRLPIDLLPQIDYPTVRITTAYEGAGPQEVESQVVERIENALAPIAGVERIESISAEGQGDVTLSFAWGTDLEAAANDIRERIDRVMPSLPDGVERPRLRFIDMSDRPVMVLGLASDLDPIELRTLAEDRIQDRLERIPGVGAVDIWGGLAREIEIAVDRGRLHAAGLALEDVRDALRDADFEVAAGSREDDRYERGLRVPGRLSDLDALPQLVVGRGDDGARVRLGDVAEVRDTYARETRRIRVDGDPGVRLGVRARTDANTVATAQALRAEIERIRTELPQVGLVVVRDTAVYIERSMHNLGRMILFGGVLALLVMLVFMRDLRAAAVAAVAIPVSLITTFALIYFAGFTLNLMTLGGMALGVGLMVDNAIVVLESVLARRERGMPAYRAAVEGTLEVAPAVTASTLTTLAIFLPLLFLEGLAGALFAQLAWVVGFALVASLLVAFTVVPMLAARLPQSGRRPQPRWYRGLERGYRRLLAGAMSQRGATLVLAAALVFLAVALFPRLGTEMMPATDEGDIRVSFEWEPGVSLEFMDARMRLLEQQVAAKVPEARHWDSSTGTGGFWVGGGNTSRIDLTLAPLAERDRSSADVARALREAFVGNVPGAEVRVRDIGMRMMRGAGGAGGEELSISVFGHQREMIDQIAERVEEAIGGVDGITDTSFSVDDSAPEEQLLIDRVRAADLNVSVTRIADTIEAAVAGARAGLYREAGEEVDIRVRLAGAHTIELEELLDLTVPSRDGELISLRNVVTVSSGESPLTIERRDRQRVTTVTANIADRDLGSVVVDVREALSGLALPRGYGWWIGGEYEEQAEALRQLTITLLLAVLLVYMVMASLYESLRNPLVVMFTVPFAGVGAVFMLWLTGTTLNAQSFIGIILLAGLVVNNGILLVDRANRSLRAGAPPRQAVLIAGRRRLRPVLMTSMTTGLALTPLALGIGEGAEAQAPMARAVLGGLLSGTLITLVVIPLVFTLFHSRLKSRVYTRSHARPRAALPSLRGVNR